MIIHYGILILESPYHALNEHVQEYIKNNMKIILSREIINKNTNQSCPICMDKFSRSSEIYVLPCNHNYCKECIEEWIKGNSRCPLCRFALWSQLHE